VGSQPAGHFTSYSYVAATTSDSMPGSNPRTAFLVQARASDGQRWWDSNPDSGYSVDNLAPAAPTQLAGSYEAGVTTLSWAHNGESDLATYRLYRGTTSSFTPQPGNLVAAVADDHYADDVGQPCYYKLSAMDQHGNESGFASLAPDATTDVPGDRGATLSLAAAPNPLVDGVQVRFSLPRDAPVSLVVYDVSGRALRVLAHGSLPAGDQVARWDGRDADGTRAPNGIFFLRLEAGGAVRTMRLVKIR
jgi:hypothetical protein